MSPWKIGVYGMAVLAGILAPVGVVLARGHRAAGCTALAALVAVQLEKAEDSMLRAIPPEDPKSAVASLGDVNLSLAELERSMADEQATVARAPREARDAVLAVRAAVDEIDRALVELIVATSRGDIPTTLAAKRRLDAARLPLDESVGAVGRACGP